MSQAVSGELLVRISADATKFRAEMAAMRREAGGALGDITHMAGNAKAALMSLVAGVGVATMTKSFIQTADAVGQMDARLKLATATEREYAQAKADVYRIAQQNNLGLQEASSLYAKLHDPVRRLGGATRETGAIVEAFALSVRVGGAGTQEAAAATLQFAQAMAAGRLNGDEFRSLVEASPRFMQALAEGMGVPIERLKELSSEGRLTADVVGNALVKGLGKLKAEAQSIPDTVGGSFQRFKNEVTKAIGELNQVSGTTLGLAATVEEARRLVPAIKGELVGAFQTVGDLIDRNRAGLGEVWQTTKALVADVWELAKALGGAVAFVADLTVQSGALRITLETARLLAAGLRDGIELIGAGFAGLGGIVTTVLVTPLVLAAEAASSVVAVFDQDLAAKIEGQARALQDFAAQGGNYAAETLKKFADGQSAVMQLSAELSANKAKAEQARVALSEHALSAAEVSNETQRLTARTGAAAQGFRTLKSALGASKEELEAKQKAYAKARQEAAKFEATLDSELDLLHRRINLGRDLTAAEKEEAELDRAIATGKMKLHGVEEQVLRLKIQNKQALKDEIAEQERARKATEDAAAAKLSETQSITQAVDALRKEVEAQQEANDTALKGATALEELRIAKLREAAASAERMAIQEADRNLNFELAEQYRQQAAELRRLADLKEQGIHIQAAKEANEAWARTTQEIGQGLTDSLYRAFEAGQGFFDTLWKGIVNTFKTTALKLMISGQDGQGGIVGSVMQAIGLGGQSGGSGGGLGSLLGGGGNLAGLGSMLTTAGNAMGWSGLSAFGTGMGLTGAQAGTASAAYGAAGMKGTGTALGMGQNVAAFAPWAALIVAGMMASNSAFSKGFNEDTFSYTKAWHATGGIAPPTMKMDTNLLQKLGLDARTANVITGASLWSKAFGHGAKELQAWGIEGSFGGGGFKGEAWADWKQKGGWFKSDKSGTDRSAVDAELSKTLGQAASEALAQAKRYGEALGLPVQSLADVQAQFRIQLGKDEKANQEAIAKALGDYADALAGTFGTQLASVKKDGETAAQALERLSTNLVGANAALGGLNVILFNASVSGAAAADKLVTLFGGLENLGALTADYYQRYYSEAEKAAMVTQQVTDTLAEAGLTMPETKEAFRKLVEAQDLTTESGQKAFAALMSVAGAFDELSARSVAVANERAGLERQLLELQGDTAALRKLELEALDPSNRALQELIWSLQDAAAAAEKTANSMVTLANGSQISGKAFAAQASQVTDAQIRAAFGIPAGLQAGSAASMSPAQLGALTQNQMNYAVGSSAWMGAAANSLVMGGQSYADFIATKNATYEGGVGGAFSATGGGSDESRKLRDSIDSLRDVFDKAIKDARMGDMSILSPVQKYEEAKAEFERLAAQAESSGSAEMAKAALAQRDVLLKTSRAVNASGAGYVADFSRSEALLSRLVSLVDRLNGTTEAGVRATSEGFDDLEAAQGVSAREARVAADIGRLAFQREVA